MKTLTRFMLVACVGLASVLNVRGTHLKAGYITYAQDTGDPTGKTYIFTLTLFRDTKGVDQPTATIDFGDGSMATVDVSAKAKVGQGVDNDTEMLIYQFRHVYPMPGNYTVGFTEQNRNDGILNMTQSVQTSFHIESSFIVDPAFGKNSSPGFALHPILIAEVGKTFVQNMAAIDAEGDSLAYQLAVPLKNKNTPVNGYVPPNKVGPPTGTTEAGTGAATFTLNSITGEIRWDAPGAKRSLGGVITGPNHYGLYTLAYVVEEWRKGVKLGSTQVDFLIVVTAATSSKQLEVENPGRIGLNAANQVKANPGQPLTFSVRYKNTGGTNPTLLTGSELLPRYRNGSVTVTDSADYKKATFSWVPTENDIRKNPYILVFRGQSQSPQRRSLSRDLTVSVFVGTDPVPDKLQVESITGPVTGTPKWHPEAMQVYPNPVTRYVRFVPGRQQGPVQLTLTDITGKQCLVVNNFGEKDFILDMDPLPTGVYLYAITSRSRLLGQGKLVKK